MELSQEINLSNSQTNVLIKLSEQKRWIAAEDLVSETPADNTAELIYRIMDLSRNRLAECKSSNDKKRTLVQI